jgi:hypothetical protein
MGMDSHRPIRKTMDEKQVTSAFIGWMRADHMLQLYEYYRDLRIKEHGHRTPDVTMVKDNDGICLFLWQACLYVVLEFVQGKNALPADLVRKFEPVKSQLREFRNCVFHIQDEFLDPRQNRLFEVNDAIVITRKVHEELGAFLTAELHRR